MPQSPIGRLRLVVLAVAAAALFIPAVQWQIFDYGARQRAQLNPAPLADDAPAGRNLRFVGAYHLAPAPDGLLPRRLFARDINDARQGEWTIADDGSLYTMPIGSDEVRIGRLNN